MPNPEPIIKPNLTLLTLLIVTLNYSLFLVLCYCVLLSGSLELKNSQLTTNELIVLAAILKLLNRKQCDWIEYVLS